MVKFRFRIERVFYKVADTLKCSSRSGYRGQRLFLEKVSSRKDQAPVAPLSFPLDNFIDREWYTSRKWRASSRPEGWHVRNWCEYRYIYMHLHHKVPSGLLLLPDFPFIAQNFRETNRFSFQAFSEYIYVYIMCSQETVKAIFNITVALCKSTKGSVPYYSLHNWEVRFVKSIKITRCLCAHSIISSEISWNFQGKRTRIQRDVMQIFF